MCVGAGTSVSSRFSVNSSHRSRKFSQTVVRVSIVIPLFIFVFGFFGESRHFPGAGSSLRSGAGLEDVLDESCGGDVEDELVPEFDYNPRTTRGTKLSDLHKIFSPCLVRCGF